jgi:hypothetical protein
MSQRFYNKGRMGVCQDKRLQFSRFFPGAGKIGAAGKRKLKKRKKRLEQMFAILGLLCYTACGGEFPSLPI